MSPQLLECRASESSGSARAPGEPGRLLVAVALLFLPIVARRVAAALAPRRPEDVPVKQRLRGSEPLSPPARARSLAAAGRHAFRGSGSRACFMAA